MTYIVKEKDFAPEHAEVLASLPEGGPESVSAALAALARWKKELTREDWRRLVVESLVDRAEEIVGAEGGPMDIEASHPH